MMRKLLLATFNPGKVREYKMLLKGLLLKLVCLEDLGIKEKFEENKKTLEENAREKAKFYAKLTNLPAIADDSGLEIEILKGEPGVKSRRWPGYEATDKELIDFTLKKLKGVPWQKRKAQLRTILALAIPGRGRTSADFDRGRTSVFAFEGKIRGIITEKPKGKLIKGYPFRTIFYLPKFKKTFAQLGFKKELEIGHRKKAIKKLIPVLRAKLLRVKSSGILPPGAPKEKPSVSLRGRRAVGFSSMKTVKFLNCKIALSKKVFQPRVETEFWVEQVLKEFKYAEKCFRHIMEKLSVLDIFAGSGCAGLAVLKNIKNAVCDFVDIDENALEQIEINLNMNKIEKGRYRIIKSNIFKNLAQRYDFILANPPYVALKRISEVQPSVLREEPHSALFAGEAGMDCIRRFLKEVKDYLHPPPFRDIQQRNNNRNLNLPSKITKRWGVKPRGKFYLEFDPQQKEEIEEILKKKGLKFKFRKDQFKKWRFLIGFK